MKRIILLLTGLIAISFQNRAQTVTDIDDNIYNIITIGNQTWMKENLKVTKLNDGTVITLVTDNSVWGNLTEPGYCNYNNTTNTDSINMYGRLYNWYTVSTNKICPLGWHVPSDGEWTALTTYLGDLTVAGGKLKETGTTHWKSPNTDATNETGFTSFPGGFRNLFGEFIDLGGSGGWWSSTKINKHDVWSRSMTSSYGDVFRDYNDKGVGLSVRCLKD